MPAGDPSCPGPGLLCVASVNQQHADARESNLSQECDAAAPPLLAWLARTCGVQMQRIGCMLCV
jgi:hypothetical protein